MPITLDTLRRYAVARTLFAPTTLARAIVKLGFVQADPIRAPARAQDLTLRHRVKASRRTVRAIWSSAMPSWILRKTSWSTTAFCRAPPRR